MKKLSILGSTGSIGTQALNIARRYKEHFRVTALAAHSNVELLLAQCREFNPDLVAITDEKSYHTSKHLFSDWRVVSGKRALEEAAVYQDVDTVVAAVVGCDGFSSVFEAVKCGKTIALANKESLVAGGKIITQLAKNTGAAIIPVDSEHSAVWQCLQGKDARKHLRRIILTASGGAFYGRTRDELSKVTKEEATRHPNWSMGKKITVDSSTMMNKGLEIIEARWLFDTVDIDYIIHRESVVHSMVEFTDGTVLAQLSYPSMEYPIQLALTYPERLSTENPPYAFDKPLTFLTPDERTFILPRLAREALTVHEGAPLVLNAANEAAVSLFLNNRIAFTHIFDIAQNVMQTAEFPNIDGKETIVAAHNLWYQRVLKDFNRFL